MKSVAFLGLAALVGGAAWWFPFGEPTTPQQPVPYPHDKHIALGLACLDCHSYADTQDHAGIPSTAKCMLCHEKIGEGVEGVEALKQYWNDGVEVPWVRVYGFDPRAHVIFRHSSHLRAGVECVTCHGDVATMSTASRAVRHTMGTCLDCHRETGASEDCAACHF